MRVARGVDAGRSVVHPLVWRGEKKGLPECETNERESIFQLECVSIGVLGVD